MGLLILINAHKGCLAQYNLPSNHWRIENGGREREGEQERERERERQRTVLKGNLSPPVIIVNKLDNPFPPLPFYVSHCGYKLRA